MSQSDYRKLPFILRFLPPLCQKPKVLQTLRPVPAPQSCDGTLGSGDKWRPDRGEAPKFHGPARWLKLFTLNDIKTEVLPMIEAGLGLYRSASGCIESQTLGLWQRVLAAGAQNLCHRRSYSVQVDICTNKFDNFNWTYEGIGYRKDFQHALHVFFQVRRFINRSPLHLRCTSRNRSSKCGPALP